MKELWMNLNPDLYLKDELCICGCFQSEHNEDEYGICGCCFDCADGFICDETNPAKDAGPYEYVITTGETILIDADDFERVDRYSWRFRKNWCVEGGPNSTLGRYLTGLEVGNPMQCHHINRRPLDNRKCNLKTLTLVEHQALGYYSKEEV